MRSSDASLRRAQPLLGTFVEVSARGAAAVLGAAVERTFGAIARIHALMSFHEPDSDVARLNRCAHLEAVGVDAHTYAVLALAARLATASEGAFDITTAPALVRFGFLPAGEAPPPPVRPRGFEAIELLPRGRVRFAERTWIDLGGIAKGYAVDVACETLEAAGITDYLVNAGGDLRIGRSPEPVYVRHPNRPAVAVPLGTFGDAALATSGAYFAGRPGLPDNVHPIIAPATGRPARYDGSVTVRASTCAEADALTKVVVVMGAKSAAVLRQFGADGWHVSTAGGWTPLAPASRGAAATGAGASA